MGQQQQSVQTSQQHLSSSSPAKSRSLQLPTSPTHLAALRGATHQRHQASFDFSNTTTTMTTASGAATGDVNMYNMSRHQQFLYPTPPSVDSVLHNNSFMSPSPDSPDQWSSASPQSHSDWSDGIHSPPALNGNGHYSQQQQQQQVHHQQQHLHQQQITQQTGTEVII